MRAARIRFLYATKAMLFMLEMELGLRFGG